MKFVFNLFHLDTYYSQAPVVSFRACDVVHPVKEMVCIIMEEHKTPL